MRSHGKPCPAMRAWNGASREGAFHGVRDDGGVWQKPDTCLPSEPKASGWKCGAAAATARGAVRHAPLYGAVHITALYALHMHTPGAWPTCPGAAPATSRRPPAPPPARRRRCRWRQLRASRAASRAPLHAAHSQARCSSSQGQGKGKPEMAGRGYLRSPAVHMNEPRVSGACAPRCYAPCCAAWMWTRLQPLALSLCAEQTHQWQQAGSGGSQLAVSCGGGDDSGTKC